MYINRLLQTDVYNLSHGYMKCNVDFEASHIVNRNAPMMLFGFDAAVHNILDYKANQDDIIEASNCARRMNMKFPSELFYKAMKYDSIADIIQVEALPDGTWVPGGTPFAQVSNIVEGFGELVTWWEPLFLHPWFASSCATRALQMKQYLEQRKESLFRFHSFGFRGHRSMEDAYWAARAWSLFLPSTDDFNVVTDLPGYSIPALAHKVVQNWDDELTCYIEAVKRSAKQGYNAVSLVIDTNSSTRFIEEYLFKVQEVAEAYNIKPVYRPDSGDCLGQAHSIASKLEGRNFGIIIGDSITFDMAKKYDKAWERLGHSCDLLTWGIGAGYYNDLERDTLGWSMKTCFSNKKDRMKYTDTAIKRSIPGKVTLQHKDGKLVVYPQRQTQSNNSEYIILNKAAPLTFKEIEEIANRQNTTQNEIILSHTLRTKMEPLRILY